MGLVPDSLGRQCIEGSQSITMHTNVRNGNAEEEIESNNNKSSNPLGVVLIGGGVTLVFVIAGAVAYKMRT